MVSTVAREIDFSDVTVEVVQSMSDFSVETQYVIKRHNTVHTTIALSVITTQVSITVVSLC